MPDTPVKDELEEGRRFAPRFDEHGLIGVIVTDAGDGAVLMFAFMNAQALQRTLETGILHFWSRSRKKLWRKGETSGETLKLVSLATDCDQDILLVAAQPEGTGATCHTGRRSCFYRQYKDGELIMTDTIRLFDPDKVYKS